MWTQALTQGFPTQSSNSRRALKHSQAPSCCFHPEVLRFGGFVLPCKQASFLDEGFIPPH